jgi:hypothetical protein
VHASGFTPHDLGVLDDRSPPGAVDEAVIDELEHGPLHRFAEYATLGDVIPGSGAGVDTIWDHECGLVYVGMAGRNPAGRGLASRLRGHASGRRSGDQFCVYVAEHYVLPELTRERIEAIRDTRLSMDALVRDKIHAAFGFRFIVVADYRRRFRSRASSRAAGCGQGGRVSTHRHDR